MAHSMRKTVCVIGAGPSGLVAAKTLLWDRRAGGLFHVTVFESQPRVGGLWPASPDDGGGLIHPQMLVNQSRHTVQFSDLAWETPADDSPETGSGGGGGGGDIPEFPRAWQVGQYLERYGRRYCYGRDDFALFLSRRVVQAEPVDGGRGGWHVWTQATGPGAGADAADVVDAGVFDYLVVASGYFGRPRVPDGLTGSTVPVLHSSAYRDLDTLLGKTQGAGAGTILVVGGQFSGVEIAATIAGHISAARHAPASQASASAASPAPHPDPRSLSVHHLIQRPFWVFPYYTSPSPAADAPPFLPIDLTSYNLRKRPQPLADTQGHISVEAARASHSRFQAMLGTDQADIHPALAMRGDRVLDAPPYMAISDTYLEHVRSGLIAVSTGKLAALSGAVAATTASATVANVAAVVLATGFSSAASLAYFSAPVRSALQLDEADASQSVALAFHGTCHPAVPHLAFVGFYRSPYWGIMEMQARVATALFVSHVCKERERAASPSPPPSVSDPWYPAVMPQWPCLAQALAQDRSMERTLALRADPRRASQFPMGDYLFLMHAFADALGLRRRPAADEASLGMDWVTPAHYVDGAGMGSAGPAAAAAADEAARATAGTCAVAGAALRDGRFVARAVFRSLQGTWRLDRTLTSRLPTHPSGRFVGSAAFLPRAATDDGRQGEDPRPPADPEVLEYLYEEDGTFTAAHGGPSFRATRRYVWRYEPALDRLSVWFVRTDDSSRADYLFHSLQFRAAAAASGGPAGPAWAATAGHLCVDDFYDVGYHFSFAGVGVRDWRLQYNVRGPKKDYTIDGTYSRRP